jgi:hypothetical protein
MRYFPKIPYQLTLHAPLILVTFATFVFDRELSADQVISICGQMYILIAFCIVINQNWLLTSLALFLLFTAKTLYIGLVAGLYMGVVVALFIEMWLAFTYITYVVERKYKLEFLQLKTNENLKRFRQMFQAVPEGILIYDQDKRSTIMSNAELERIVDKYSSFSTQQLLSTFFGGNN